MKNINWRKFLVSSITILFAVIWLVPLVWMLSTSLKPESQVVSWPINLIPENFSLKNYSQLLLGKDVPVFRWFFNSTVVATMTTIIVLFIDALAAYAYARMKFKGRDTIFWILMATMMIPPTTNLIPNYIMMDKFGWINTYNAMIFPRTASVFGVFLLRQFFIGLPKDLEDAARIDGCNQFQTFYKIILPLTKPALIVLGIFTFRGSWNSFLWPLIVTNSEKIRPLTPALSLLQDNYATQYGKLMAGAFISAIPVIIIFFFVQRYFVQGISLTGMKG
ncbi:ABC-type sugar transport system, permease component [Halobacteroides halobius DSM 5150]|uniref:ABC-type sugar transport system, permease component n=1 Tax=Halobacteroides halobius (strain ATCC 35273 / DSM 5150 / MD-1) TaxID=748449 RepID=L0K7J8_HALHC|nr:carbohydrate ABC transporter permease [Halobacteroides halobius]AGB41262.1 ABC-type sugar transport system, permease component [Halobacteroides halobius DSM 5150]